MKNKILHHPALRYASDIAEICKPLNKLQISYFGHAFVDTDGRLAALGVNPKFFEHYFTNEYQNADIHMAKDNKFGGHIIWDEIERCGRSLKMHSEAAQFGVQHTFTIIEKDKNGSHYYHFANDSTSKSINQSYLANFDLLKLFIQHFNENVHQSKHLSSAYKLKFELDKLNGRYDINESNQIIIENDIRSEFINSLNISNKHPMIKNIESFLEQRNIQLSKREMDVLLHLIRGKSARIIAEILFLSTRTVECHIDKIKNKMGLSSKGDIISSLVDILFV